MRRFFRRLRVSMLYGRATGLLVKGKLPEAKGAIDRLLTMPDQFLGAVAHALKGEIEFKLGNWEEARKSLGLVLADAAEHPERWTGTALAEELVRVRFYSQRLPAE